MIESVNKILEFAKIYGIPSVIVIILTFTIINLINKYTAVITETNDKYSKFASDMFNKILKVQKEINTNVDSSLEELYSKIDSRLDRIESLLIGVNLLSHKKDDDEG